MLVDDDETSTRASTRATTPLPGQSKELGNGAIEALIEKPSPADKAPPAEKDGEQNTDAAPELPGDVRVKLRKLDRLEPRYQGMTIGCLY